MKKLFIIAALVITAVGYARSISTVQRAVDANSSEGIRLQNRYWGPTLPPWREPQDINVTLTGQTLKYGSDYLKLVNSTETPYYIRGVVADIKCQIFLDSGALCTVYGDDQSYIFIPAEDIKDFENAVSGYRIPHNTEKLVCDQKINPGPKHASSCSKCGFPLFAKNGYEKGWNLYRKGWLAQNGIRIPIFSLKNPKEKKQTGNTIVE